MDFLDERRASGWEVSVTAVRSGDKVVSKSVSAGDQRRRGHGSYSIVQRNVRSQDIRNWSQALVSKVLKCDRAGWDRSSAVEVCDDCRKGYRLADNSVTKIRRGGVKRDGKISRPA